MTSGPNTRPRRTSSVIALLAVLVCAAQTAAAKPALPAGWTGLLTTFVEGAQRDRIVGATIALVQDGSIVARHDYGFADLATQRRVDGDTLFHWASITKTLNAIAIMQLRDHGQLSLDDPLTDYLPELRQGHNPFGAMADNKIAMVLEHSAGFQAPTWPYQSGAAWEPFEPTRWEQLVAMMPYQQIAFPPGSRFSYSNPSWIYLARILEQKTGDPWDAYIQKNIFAPLGMTRSYFRVTPYHLREHRSHNYSVKPGANGEPQVIDHGAEFDPGVTAPNGGWNGSLADAAAFIGFLTGSTGGRAELAQRFQTVLKRSTLEEMWQPRQRLAPDSDGYMGFAFFVTGEGDHRVIGHTGGQANFSTLLYFNPHTRSGVVAAFNTENKLDQKQRPLYFRHTQQKVLELLR